MDLLTGTSPPAAPPLPGEERPSSSAGSPDPEKRRLSSASDEKRRSSFEDAPGRSSIEKRPPTPHDDDDATEEEPSQDKEATDLESARPIGPSTPEDAPLEKETALQKALTALSTSARSIRDPGPPPDGGSKAWTQVAMGHIVVTNTWGFVNSFGVFQAYYTTTMSLPASTIAWIGTVQVFLLFFVGAFSGRALDAGLFRPVFVVGTTLNLLGIFMTSLLPTRYWHVLLSQGVCAGLGSGLMFCPAMALVSTYFSRRRAFAIGIVAAGSATGGWLYPTLVRELLPRVGFGWTIRTLGFLTLATSALTIAFFAVRIPPRTAGPLVELAAFREPPYALYCCGAFFVFWGLYVPFWYTAAFSRDIIGLSFTDSLNLLLLLNGVGYITRTLPGLLADRFRSPLNFMAPFALASGALIFAWAGVGTPGGLYAWTTFMGLCAAGCQGLFPAVLTSLTTDLSKTGTRMGMAFSIVSFACLTGPPIGGALINALGGRYLAAQLWAGCMVTLGGCLLIATRVAKVGWKWRARV